MVHPPQHDERYNCGPSLVVDKSKGNDSGMCECKSASDKDAGEDNDGDNKDTGKGDDCKEKAKRPKRSQVDCLLEKAQKLRSQILTTQSQAAQLVAASKADSQAWRFANVGELERLVSKMQLSISEFGRKFLLADANDVKKNYTSEDLCAHLAGFLASAADAPGVASRECEPAPHAAHVQGPWLALIETH